MAKRVQSNRSPIDADYYYNCKHPSGVHMCTHSHTHHSHTSIHSCKKKEKSSPSNPNVSLILRQFAASFVLFYREKKTLSFFRHIRYHFEELVFQIYLLFFRCSLHFGVWCYYCMVVTMFILAFRYVSRIWSSLLCLSLIRNSSIYFFL